MFIALIDFMEQITHSYALYWITAYFTLFSLGIYGHLKLRKSKRPSPILCLRYFAIVIGSFFSFWLVWKFASFLVGDLTAEQLGTREIGLADPARLLIELFAGCVVLFLITGLFRSKMLHAVKYLIIIIGFFFGMSGVFTAHGDYQSKVTAEFPAGEKRDLLANYLTSKGYQSSLFALESSTANAWVSQRTENPDIYFTTRSISILSKEQLLSVLTHEIGHKYEPSWAHSLHRNFGLIAATIFLVWLMFLCTLLCNASFGKKFGLMLSDERSENLPIFKSVIKNLPRQMTSALLILVTLSLPAVFVQNYLQRAEELHADEVAKRLLEEAQLPVAYRAEGLRIMHNSNIGSEEEPSWLYQLYFNDHPPTRDRISALHLEE